MKKETDSKLLIRIDERQKVVLKEIGEIKESVDSADQKYIGKMEFKLTNKQQNDRICKIEKLVFGSIGLALITLGKAALDLIIVTKAAR